MPPSSYQAPTRGDRDEKTVSQSTETNLSSTTTTVETLLEKKGTMVFSVKPNQTIQDAVQVLSEKRIGALLVLDDRGTMHGILSERDIVRKMAETPGETLPQKVEDLMTQDVVTCKPSDALVTVLQKMTDGRFRHMPVIDDNGSVQGMVTIGDVVHYRLNEVEYEALKMKQMIVG